MTYPPANLAKIEQDLEKALTDKALAQARLEMAADIFHDIGNAVVGFGAYLTRIRYSMDENKTENLTNLAGFFADRKDGIGAVIGEVKAAAIVNMLRNMADVQEATANEIRKSIEGQLHIIAHIQEILNIHRHYAAGEDSCEKRPVHLRSLIGDCLAMLYASIDKRQIKVTVNCTDEEHIIPGDRTRLLQVIMNLLKNSIEAIDRNAADKTILIRLYAQEDGLILEIKDSGSGFAREQAPLLFDRGFTTKSSGTGLGLHNCRAILESHSGALSLSSDGPGKGAIAMIKFKIQKNP